jgi:ribonuclease P protein component
MPRIAAKLTRFTQKEIDKLFTTIQYRVKNPAMDILLCPKQKDFGRLLLIVSRKVGNAPERNKIRRRLKSIFYEEKFYHKPFDCIIIAKKEAVPLSFDALKKLLQNAYNEKKN